MAELKTLDLRPGGQTAHVWEGGDANAPALLFLHPITGIPRWGDALESLAQDFHVIAPYQPGWGPAKDDLPGARDGLDLVLFNVDLLNTLGVGSAHVVGVSIGGWIGAEIAAIRPDAVQSLTLVNPLGLWSEQYPGEDAFAQHPGFPTAVLFSNPGQAHRAADGRSRSDGRLRRRAARPARLGQVPVADSRHWRRPTSRCESTRAR